MTTRFLGPTGSRRRRRFLLGPILITALVGLFLTAGAQAVHDVGVFELDGNAVNDPAVAGDDWDVIFANAPNCPGAQACTFLTEGANASIFTGGGSKDDLDTTQWRHKSGSVPDKDDLADAYAVRYESGGQTYLYFGTDRIANNGDSQLGFWFFQGDVRPQAGGTFGPDDHEDGDVLVLSDFTGGGANVTVRIFEWNGPGGSIPGSGSINGTLDPLGPAVNQDCAVVGTGDNACGTVNDALATSPWPFVDKTGSTAFRTGEFFEGGINLTFLGLAGECFTTFQAESRSSQSVDATLKDFINGVFAPCEATLVTTPSAGAGGEVTPGTPVTDLATVQGSGLANPPTPTGDVTFFLCGPIASPAVCDTGGTQVGSPVPLADSSPPAGEAQATSAAVNTAANPLAPGRYCFRAEWPGDENYPGALSHAGTGNSECFTVAKIPTNTVTTPVDGSGTPVSTISLGGSIFDRAVVTGNAVGGDPTGEVNFFVCGPIAAPAVCDTGGTAVAGNPKTLIADSDPATFTSSATSGEFMPTEVGRYCFRAEYGGSTVYLPSSDSGANECFTVTAQSAVATAQDWLPNDTATITTTPGAPVNGTLDITLHQGGDCTGTVLYTEPTININQASPAMRSTNNASVRVTASSTVSWKSVFTPTSSFISPSTRCETTSLVITN
jgi:Bacterial Ig-like domain (group 3)